MTIRVPATTSNLGPGFDTLGIALQLYNFVRVIRRSGQGIHLVSAIGRSARKAASEMLDEAAQLFFRHTGKRPVGLEVDLSGEVPVARGLGSSVTARLGVMAGLNELLQTKLERQDLLNLVTELEHHPDNAAPAIFGGFTVAGIVGKTVRCLAFPVAPQTKFIALIPRFEVGTQQARRLVPDTFTKADTIHNLNRTAFISAGFAHGDVAALRGLFSDRMHQPYRQPLIPQLPTVIRAGEKAGAIGGWLSGSGSTIVCLALKNAEEVAKSMQKQLPDSEVKILSADNRGFIIVEKVF